MKNHERDSLASRAVVGTDRQEGQPRDVWFMLTHSMTCCDVDDDSRDEVYWPDCDAGSLKCSRGVRFYVVFLRAVNAWASGERLAAPG